MKTKISEIDQLGVDDLRKKLKKSLRKNRMYHKRLEKLRFWYKLWSGLTTLLVTVSVIIILTTMFLPVFRIYGTSMNPTLKEGDVVIAAKDTRMKQGDLVAFYIGNKILVKRYIAGSGQWVNIDDDGNVYVDGELLDEPYLTEKAFGECDLDLPYQVPEGKIFVMGDHRSVSLDSRSTTIGPISDEQIAGRLVFRVWPIPVLGKI